MYAPDEESILKCLDPDKWGAPVETLRWAVREASARSLEGGSRGGSGAEPPGTRGGLAIGHNGEAERRAPLPALVPVEDLRPMVLEPLDQEQRALHRVHRVEAAHPPQGIKAEAHNAVRAKPYFSTDLHPVRGAGELSA
jgi:hypothetical protein